MVEKVETKTVLPEAALDALRKGKIVFYGEFRKGIAVEINGRGGKTFHQSKMVVETAEGVITVAEFLADSVDWKAWQPPFQKGQMVFGICSGLESNSGAQVATAKLTAV